MTATIRSNDGDALAKAIGSILRAARRAAEINQDRGACGEVATCARDIRIAAERVEALCGPDHGARR